MAEETVLVVDDNKEIVYSISELLKYEGYRTLAAYDGMQALELLEAQPAEQIYENVWHDEACFAVENTVMVHIRHIREKIEIEPKKPRYIKVVRGIGYKMEKFD